METKWIYKNKNNIEKIKNLSLSSEFINILINRGIDSEKKINEFINPKKEDIVSPFQFKDIEKAIKKIREIGENNGSIFIYGDYDVDGITSTSLCYLSLKNLGYKVNYYIPLRDEGYGLNRDALLYIKEQKCDLVITVDCGISSIDEVAYAHSLGLNIIITDHHEINDILPKASAVINPKRGDNSYKDSDLAGVGTVFMLMMGLYETLDRKKDIYTFLDLVAIGTIADMVPLKKENRIITKLGLEQLNNTSNIGLKVLLQEIFGEIKEKVFNTYDIGFMIAPVFNASGRLEDAKLSVKLLTSDSIMESKEISKKLIAQNIERKTQQANILKKVELEIEKNRYHQDDVIVISGVGFSHGIIGIVASKIVDKYYKPTVIMEEKNGISKASCRSISGYSIIEGLNSMKEIFIKYGGHEGAAGFSINSDKVNEFREKINKHIKSKLSEEDYKKPIKIDQEISFNKLIYSFYSELEKAEPYGFGNPTPLFELKNILLDRVRLIGKDQTHIMFDAILKDEVVIKNCVWFNSSDKFSKIINMKTVDVAFKLKLDSYMDRFSIKMFIEDMRDSDLDQNSLKDNISIYDTVFPIEVVVYNNKKIDINSQIFLDNSSEFTIKSGHSTVGYLPSQVKELLKKLQNGYNYRFEADIIAVIKKEKNYNIHIKINKDHKFKTYHFKPNKILIDIKKFILGDYEYNSLQKKGLSAIFKENKNPLIIYKGNRGMKSYMYNIAIWNKIHNKKTLIITKNSLPQYFTLYMDIATEYKSDYDYYIYYNQLPDREIKDNFTVITKKNIDIKNSKKILDEIILPTNIIFLDEYSMIIDYNNSKTYYTKKNPVIENRRIIENLKNHEIIYATEDIRRVL